MLENSQNKLAEKYFQAVENISKVLNPERKPKTKTGGSRDDCDDEEDANQCFPPGEETTT